MEDYDLTKAQARAAEKIQSVIDTTESRIIRDILNKAKGAIQKGDVAGTELLLIHLIIRTEQSDDPYVPDSTALKRAWTHVLAVRSLEDKMEEDE